MEQLNDGVPTKSMRAEPKHEHLTCRLLYCLFLAVGIAIGAYGGYVYRKPIEVQADDGVAKKLLQEKNILIDEVQRLQAKLDSQPVIKPVVMPGKAVPTPPVTKSPSVGKSPFTTPKPAQASP